MEESKCDTSVQEQGKKSDLKNYRPISLLICIGKILERVIHEVIFMYLLDSSLVAKYQAAYLPISSTEMQVIELYHKIQEALDEDKDVRFLFLAVSKAFDKVWRSGLLAKLKMYGIDGKLHK